MDENTWRFAQLMMWLIGIQTTVLIAAFGGMWIAISRRFESIDKRFESIDKRFESIEKRLDKLDEKVTDIDKRVFAIETMLHMKDCCMLKDERQIKKAE